MKDLIIVGAGGQGRETVQLVRDINRNASEWNLLGFLDDREELLDTQVIGLPVLGDLNKLAESPYNQAYFICAVGDSLVRRKIIGRMKEIDPYCAFATLIHPTAVIGDRIHIGEGTVICAQCVVTTNVTIAEHVLVNYCSSVGHDSALEEGVTLLPGSRISGGATLGQSCSIGSGAVVLPGIDIGYAAIIGAGAVVNKSIPSWSTAVGVPAQVIKSHNKNWQVL
ncbi:acetyltransferase [Paenibacillus sp. FJAT-26967]|uniref:acetyltransferase n=1 Tax=Paenibacillus sp. FJAT-26967 TaxID=1729690 RepID=UPI000838D3BD|nr:acetyltransferase [Paenibacillus sp. FJAT-26967]